jgi:hypothetical protein
MIFATGLRKCVQKLDQRLLALVANRVIKGLELQRMFGLRRYVRAADHDRGGGAGGFDRLGEFQGAVKGHRRGRNPQHVESIGPQRPHQVVVGQVAGFRIEGLNGVTLLAKVGCQAKDPQRNLLSAEDPQFAPVPIHFADGRVDQQNSRRGRCHVRRFPSPERQTFAGRSVHFSISDASYTRILR